MKSRTAYLTSLAAICLSICASVVATAQQDPSRQLVQTEAIGNKDARRVALVIGNGSYTNAPGLKNPPNDARDMAATLRTLGFDVTSGVNLNQRDMKRLIREFGMKLKGGGSGLFYYAGHGVQSKGGNYLIPVDADIQSEAEVEDSAVDVNLVLSYMDDAQNSLNIVILDACRNNPFARSFRSAASGLAQVDAPTGTLIAYATSPGRVARDGQGLNGLYTSELLNQMRVTGIGVEDMFKRVRAEVQKQTGGQQVPWESSSLVGNFYFAGGAGDSSTVANTSKIDPIAFELSYWETIKNSTNVDDFKAYVARYPQGQFAELAKNRINSLAPKISDTSSRKYDTDATELAFWDAIKSSPNPEDYQAYIRRYPAGVFVELAANRIKTLSAAADKGAPAAQPVVRPLQFSVHNGKTGSAPKGILFVSASGIDFLDNKHPSVMKLSYTCAEVKEAKVDGGFPRDKQVFRVRVSNNSHNFRAGSGNEASSIVDIIRSVCKLDEQGKKP